MKKTFILWAVGLVLLAGCGRQKRIEAGLAAADSLMWISSDSSRAILASLPVPEGRRLRARYGLLYSQAQDKCNVIVTDDSLIRPAIDYYALHGSADDKLRTLYYRGRIYENGGDAQQAMACYTEAEVYADQATDHRMLGRLFASIAQLYDKFYNHTEELKYMIKSAEHFGKTDMRRHWLYARESVGEVYGFLQEYDKADSIIEAVYHEAEHFDTLLMSRCLSAMALHAWHRDDWIRTKHLILKRKNVLHVTLPALDEMRLGRIYTIERKPDSVDFYMSAARQHLKENYDSIQLHLTLYNIALLKGRHKEAHEELLNTVMMQYPSLYQGINRSTMTVRHDLLIHKFQEARYQAEIRLLRAVLVILVLSLIITYIIYRLRKRRRQVNTYASRLTASEADFQAHKVRTYELIQRFLRNRFDLIDRLADTLYERQHGGKEAIYSSVKDEIDNLASDPETLAGLEQLLDESNDGVITRLRTQLPTLREQEIRLFCYFAAGFSPRTVSLFLQDKIENLYNKKSRLKAKILSSEAPDKEEFAKTMAN